MATQSTIQFSYFSFIGLENSPTVICEPQETPCLPLSEFEDYAWQEKVESFGSNGDPGNIRYFRAIALKECSDFSTTEPIIPFAFRGVRFDLNENPDYEAVIQYVATGITWDEYNADLVTYGFEPIEEGDCFRIIVYEEVREPEVGPPLPNAFVDRWMTTCSGCMIRTPNTCYLTRIRYRNEDDAFGFIFSDSGITTTLYNSALLPFYLLDPQFDTNNASYQKSNQQIIKLFEVITEAWGLQTNDMPLEWHRRLDVALSCDVVNLYNVNHAAMGILLTTNFVKNEKYEIEWKAVPYNFLGQATTKVSAAEAMAYRNNNC